MTDEESKAQNHESAGEDALSEMRHSLRTPLNQIIGYAELLQEEVEEAGLVDILLDLQKIHTAGHQLLALINDTLAPWKLETGRIDLDSMRLEMRTPLNLVIGYSELCQELVQEMGKPKLNADLQKINAAAKNLLALFESSSFPSEMEIVSKSKPAASARATLGRGAARHPAEGEADESRTKSGNILIADDNEMNRDMLCRRLERQGYQVTEVEDGQQVLDIVKTRGFDLILLDVVMPRMNGLETLKHLMADESQRHLPIIMLSALDEIENVVRCIEIGAEDYVTKPFNPVLLNARITASLEKKRLRDQERAHAEMLNFEREKSEHLLLNVLPKSIADRLKQGESKIADNFANATVLFADIVEFSRLATRMSPSDLVELLNDIFSRFDWLAELHGLEKIKTIGDAYMIVAGLPKPRTDHASAVAEMALEMQKVIKRFAGENEWKMEMRIGISSGSVVAGVIGRKKFTYDLWGDTVNLASRMEFHGEPGRIHVAQSTYEQLRDKYVFESRGKITVKGKGQVSTYFLTGRVNRGLPASATRS